MRSAPGKVLGHSQRTKRNESPQKGMFAFALASARQAAAQRDAIIWPLVLTMSGTGTAMLLAQLLLG